MAAMLDSPPPSPQLQAASPSPSFGGLTPDAAMGPQPDMGGLLDLGMQIDDSLLLLAQAAPVSAQEISQARDLVKSAIAKVVMSTSGAGGGTGTLTGNQFPGAPPGMK